MARAASYIRARAACGARADKGFTILESVTAATILLVVAVGVMTVLVTTSSWYAKAKVRTQANAVANEVMAKILSRNYGDLHVDSGETTSAVWPAIIPAHMDWATSIGTFTVETTMAPATDPATKQDMRQITVTADSMALTLDPPVRVIRYASGWQGMTGAARALKVPVHVQCSIRAAGVRVQLLDPNTMLESRYAVTDGTGLAVFKDVLETPDGYFLTSDPRFGTDIRPEHFPTRILPTHGGSANNPILTINKYDLDVVRSSVAAVLRVGVYRGAGWRFSAGQPVSTTLPYNTLYDPAAPNDPAKTLTVFAAPTLNTRTGSGLYGVGSKSRYPDDSAWPLQKKMVYRGTVNAYGVACIQVPWTTQSEQGQYWTVWCTTDGPDVQPLALKLTSSLTGGWPVEALSATRPELPSSGVYVDIPQWSFLDQAEPGPLDATPPTR